MERHASMEKQMAFEHKSMQMEKQMAQGMHQKAVENQIAHDRFNRLEKENYIMRSSEVVPSAAQVYAGRYSPNRRQSPVREYIIARRSVSPMRNRDSPLRSTRWEANVGAY